MGLLTGARKIVSGCLRPIARHAAQSYVAGERLEDAVRVAQGMSERGLGVTLGYWDGPDDSPRRVTDEYLAGIESLAGREHAYLSIKVPSLGFSRELLGEVVERAGRCRVRVHFDALAPETVDRSRTLIEEFLDRGTELSFTLPGRWARSVDDAAWAVEHGLIVRVVKGQWADPADPHRDPRTGFLQVIESLAGRARHVAVASHDVPIVAQAVGCLRAAGTSCGMELLFGLPMHKSLQLADSVALGVHVYVPYGKSYLPYALSRLRGNPRMMWWLVRDFFAACRPVSTSDREVRELVTR